MSQEGSCCQPQELSHPWSSSKQCHITTPGMMVLSGLEPLRKLNTALQSEPFQAHKKIYRHHQAQSCIPSCWLLQFCFISHVSLSQRRHFVQEWHKNQPLHHILNHSVSPTTEHGIILDTTSQTLPTCCEVLS